MTQWMQFITYRPKIVLIDTDGKPHTIRNNETLETMNALDIIPEHLDEINL